MKTQSSRTLKHHVWLLAKKNCKYSYSRAIHGKLLPCRNASCSENPLDDKNWRNGASNRMGI